VVTAWKIVTKLFGSVTASSGLKPAGIWAFELVVSRKNLGKDGDGGHG